MPGTQGILLRQGRKRKNRGFAAEEEEEEEEEEERRGRRGRASGFHEVISGCRYDPATGLP